jgi:hypothetical protein
VLTLTALLTKLPVVALANSERYAAYRKARDWAESALVGRTPVGATHVRARMS